MFSYNKISVKTTNYILSRRLVKLIFKKILKSTQSYISASVGLVNLHEECWLPSQKKKLIIINNGSCVKWQFFESQVL